MGLSHLGIFHTIIGVVAIIAACVSLFRSAKIDLGKLSGKIYFYFTLIASLSALGLSSVKGVNPGHILALLIVILILWAYYLHVRKPGNNRSRFFENFFLSFSFFLSLLPAVNETFTRVPVGHPLASGPADPLIAKTLLTLFLLFLVSSILQFRNQRRINNASC
ncbi:hypothetical protein FEM33_17740 [Dyadobacter flavalbus]|uniref:DUF2306 domain-containing protein n=1 Tax=Dyadobacter flavalbus TaxID=2579942 RepID=A0A5M8QQK0_9BACT|nr:hypothetical protein [Dyadobacter flavalbus]KAA6438527.1 hypothetical protein FEM33_17740 [Dyadobacter flavalbus]